MNLRNLLLPILLIGGIVAAENAWAASPSDIQKWKAQCDKGGADGCALLGLMYEDGQGVKQDPSQAVALYRKACAGGAAGVCVLLGLMYEDGQGARKSTTAALTYFGKACDLKEERGCENYATLKQRMK